MAWITDESTLQTLLQDSDNNDLGAGNVLGDILADLLKLTTSPTEKKPVKVTQFVATASTAEALVGSETFATAVYLQARKVNGPNTGNVFIGLDDLDQGSAELFEVEPGQTWEYKCSAGRKVDLNDIYIDADTADDGVVGWYEPA